MLVVYLIMTLNSDEERLSDIEEEEQEENIHNKPDRQKKYGKPQNIKDVMYTMKHCGWVGFYIGLPEILESFE